LVSLKGSDVELVGGEDLYELNKDFIL